ncbi:MAG: hypothetical protein HY815_11100 [Candidatus Riflebacteria bacterium]|nr:hypothetical protein [Candidatus Riflebacteria bacterium]
MYCRAPSVSRRPSKNLSTRSTAVRAAWLVALLIATTVGPLGAEPPAPSREADVTLHLMNVVMDAPWRVQARPGKGTYIPILVFFPETKEGWRQVKVLSIRIAELGSQGVSLLYEDTSASGPVLGQSSTSAFSGREMTAVNGFGVVAPDLDIVRDKVEPGSALAAFAVSEINDDNRGWHTILRLPVPDSAVATGSGQITLLAQVEYRRVSALDTQVYTIKRRLEVTLDRSPLPCLPGWRSFDTHAHTLAEYSSDLSYKAIRKAFGGPVQMLKECALAVGFIDSIDQFKDRVMTTDHNTFFSDREWVRYGPTTSGIAQGSTQVLHPELAPYFVDLDGKPFPEGQREFENYVDLFGVTFGEEVTLAKSGGVFDMVAGTLGSHLVTYSTRHFMGPFHGGRFFIFRDEPNPNTIEKVLTAMASDPRYPDGFCYAAHPFSNSWLERRFLFAWTNDQIESAIHGDFIRRKGDRDHEFVFKGFQLWNQKRTRIFSTNPINPYRLLELLEDPSNVPEWKQGDPIWDEELNQGLQIYHQAISECLSIPASGNAAHRFIRKFYMSGGTDAHGDFNRASDMMARGLAALPAQILRFLKAFTVADNAYGKVRTCVLPAASPEAGQTTEQRAVYAFAHGQSIVTDGPVLEFALDSSGRFDSARRRWHAQPAFEDTDGQIGGDGDMDGARTLFVPEGGRDALVRYRFSTSSTFGGDLERIELYRDEAGGRVKLVKVNRPTGKASVLEAQGALDPRAPADPDGWRVAPLKDAVKSPDKAPVRCLSAFSLGGFTRWLLQPPFDHRVYTNPIWAVPIKLVVRSPAPSGPIAPGELTVSFVFPVSMSPKPCEVRLVPLGPDGNSTGEGVPLVPVGQGGQVAGWSGSVRAEVANSVYTVVNKVPVPAPATTSEPPAYCLWVAGLADHHGNPANTVAWKLVSTASGLVVEHAAP